MDQQSRSPRASGGSAIFSRLPTFAVVGIFVLLIPGALYLGRGFLLPIFLAFLLKYLLTPLVRAMGRLRIGPGVAAGLILLALGAAVGTGAYYLAEPASEWLARAPATLRKLEQKLRPLRAPIERVTKATEQVEELTTLGQAPDPDPQKEGVTVEVTDRPDLGTSLVSGTWSILANAVVILILLYFLLAAGDLFLRKLVSVLPTLDEKKRAVDIARQIEGEISGYLTTITIVNLAFGVAVGMAMWALGMPNPALWGVLAAATNYLPYLGAVACGSVLAVVALLTFDGVGRALLVPGVFFLLNFAEAYFATPKLLGRRLTLNPVAIFMAVAFWGWIWGIAGALLAVPLLAAVKILCDRIEGLRPIGEFLGE